MAQEGGRDADATYRALLAAALELFEAHGYHGTSVQRIADTAGLTKGAFYHHFVGKEQVLHDLHDGFVDHHLTEARELLGAGLPPEETLRRFVRDVLIGVTGRHRRETAVFYQEHRFISGETFGPMLEKRDRLERLLVDFIADGVRSGDFRDGGPARLLAFAVLGMCAWSFTWFEPDGEFSPAELGDLYATLLLGGLREPPSPD